MKALPLLKHNIDTLLKARGQTRRELAQWVRQSINKKKIDPWISHIFTNPDAEFQMKYLDRIADFFGISVYQLFQPGISPLTERRNGERRKLADRRISARNRELPQSPIRRLDVTPEDESLLAELHSLTHAEYERVKHWVQVTRLGRGSGPVREVPAAPAVEATPPAARVRRTRAAARK